MPEILQISAEVKNQELVLGKDISYIKDQLLKKKNIVILKNLYNASQMQSLKKAIHLFGQSREASNPELKSDSPNFHRIDDNPKKAAVLRIMHTYNVFFWNEANPVPHEYFIPSTSLQRQVSSLSQEFLKGGMSDGLVCSGRVSHYPRGGGYYARHVDPTDIEKCSVLLMMTTRGKDFNTGGLYLEPRKGQVIDMEGFVQAGDLVVFDQSIPHGVAPIDPEIPGPDWNSAEGRWMLLSTIAPKETYSAPGKRSAFAV